MRSLLSLVAVALVGCTGETSIPRDGMISDIRDGGLLDGQLEPSGVDSDGDGLCDDTEDQQGTSPESMDSDDDGLPDVVEVIYGFVATDPRSPSDDEVVYLEARPGAEARLNLRFTVDGTGGDFSGFFEDSPSPYDDGSSAGQYLVGSQAISSEPPEAVRVIDGSRQLFRAVLGTARLELEALFRADDEIDTETCSRAYPFRYGLREDDVGLVDDHLYLLVVAAPETGVAEFCQPRDCI
jgi:hypothetical protein